MLAAGSETTPGTTIAKSTHRLVKPKSFNEHQRPRIAFSFDDGSTQSYAQWTTRRWNDSLLSALRAAGLRAMLCVKGSSMDNERGKEIMAQWSAAGHVIANHSYHHRYYASPRMTVDSFRNELLLNHKLVSHYSGFQPFFRFPYLKEGESRAKIDSARAILSSNGYRNAHVSIDASDWYISSRLERALLRDSLQDLSGLRDFYIAHLYDRACYYDSLATLLTKRKVSHVILLHHNLAAALFLGDLVRHFRSKGWELMNVDEAYKDPFYTNSPSVVPAGESLVWSLAKQSARFNKSLRYPAEDGDYEEVKMNALGLP